MSGKTHNMIYLHNLVYLAFLLGNDEIDLLFIIGKIFVPMAYILGIPSQDIDIVSKRYSSAI